MNILPKILIILFLILVPFQCVNASDFFDDFNDRNDFGWIKFQESGTHNVIPLWSAASGEYGMYLNYPSTQTNSYIGDQDWTNIDYEFDMNMVKGSDRNFVFRYTQNPPGIPREIFYGVHINNLDIRLEKPGRYLVEDPNLPTFNPPITTYPFSNGNTYHWRVHLIGNSIKIYVKDNNSPTETLVMDYVDNNHPYLSGKVGVRITTGSAYPTEVYFDNIKVTDLTPPTPTPTPPYLDVPFFSQNDDPWGNMEYDSARKSHPAGKDTIDWYGCALTSSAMVLKYFGVDFGPDGQETNPLTLNQYLLDHNGYTRYHGVIWSAITRYANDAVDNGQVAADTPKLKFTYPMYSVDRLQETLGATTPAILKLVMNDHGTPSWNDDSLHFVVAKGLTDNHLIYINDPEKATDGATTKNNLYPDKDIRQLGIFTPTHTDLSYLWLYQYYPDVKTLITKDQRSTGITPDNQSLEEIPQSLYFIDGSIIPVNHTSEPLNPGDIQTTLISTPSSGMYHLTFSSTTSAAIDAELHLFDQKANDKPTLVQLPLLPDIPITFQFYFDKDNNADTTQPILLATNDTLIQIINAAYNQGWITTPQIRNQLLKLVNNAYKNHPPSSNAQQALLYAFINVISDYHTKGMINDKAYILLHSVVNVLSSNLSPPTP